MGEVRRGHGEGGEAAAEGAPAEAEEEGAQARGRPLREDIGAQHVHELGEVELSDGGRLATAAAGRSA